MVYFNELFTHSSEGTEENTKKKKLQYSASGPSRPGAFPIKTGIVTTRLRPALYTMRDTTRRWADAAP
jgi:hypothetical protein